MSPTDERAARRKRAQAEGRRRVQHSKTTEPPAQETATAALVVERDAESVSKPPTVLIEPDTHERQAKAALARLEAAEHARKASVIPPQRASSSTRKSVAKSAATSAPTKAARREPKSRARTTTPVVPVKVEDAVAHMQVEHLQCRDFGHSWRPYSARWLPTFNQYESQLLCARCKTIRTRFLSRTGGLMDSKYDYADGYTIKGLGRLTGTDRDVIRLQSILQVLPTDTAADE